MRRKGNIRRALLDEHALTVVRRLNRFGHEAYLVGGCVRDLLVGLEPKDFDVVTDARPNRIKRIFRNARIIGRRFRLAHIRFDADHVIETATFRANVPDEEAPGSEGAGSQGARARPSRHAQPPEDAEEGRRRHGGDHENVFGTAPEDARRRDFTINALFYDPVEDEILDWVGGLEDLESGLVRSIGEPARRIREDPVRMIRAVHFAARMDFALEEELEQAIHDSAHELENASPARLYVELLKVLTRARARSTLHRLHDMGVLRYWLPEIDGALQSSARWPSVEGGTHEEASHGEPEVLPVSHATWNLLGAADRWGLVAHGAGDTLTLATLLGPWILDRWRADGGRHYFAAFSESFDETVRPLARRMSVPRRTLARLRDVLWVSLDLHRPPEGKRAQRLAHRPAFPHALDYLRLDLMARDCPPDLYDAWNELRPARRPDADRRRSEDGTQEGRTRGRRRRGDRGSQGRRGRGRGARAAADQEGRPDVGTEAAAWTPAPERPASSARRTAEEQPARAPGTSTPEEPGPRESGAHESSPRESSPHESSPHESSPHEPAPRERASQDPAPPKRKPSTPRASSAPARTDEDDRDDFAEGL